MKMSPTSTNNNNMGPATQTRNNVSGLDPRIPVLVQPFKRLVEEGYITELSVVFTPMGVSTYAKVDHRVVKLDSSFTLEGRFPVSSVARLADETNLIPKKGAKKGGSKEQPLPKKSLTESDFSSAAALTKRAGEVAAAVGGTGLIGRIGSGGLLPPQTMSFVDWWAGASGSNRITLLASKDHREKILAGVPKWSELLEALDCPFRDSLEVRVAVALEEGEEAAQARPPRLPQRGQAQQLLATKWLRVVDKPGDGNVDPLKNRIDKNCPRAGPVLLRRQHWMDGVRDSKKEFVIPFINKSGHVSTQSVGLWKTSPQCLFASLVTSTYFALRSRFRRTIKNKRYLPRDSTVFRIALQYIITNNTYELNRLVEMVKHRKPVVHALYKNCQKMDGKNRFLSDQAWQQATWFQLRAARPRVKSIERLGFSRAFVQKARGSLKNVIEDWGRRHQLTTLQAFSLPIDHTVLPVTGCGESSRFLFTSPTYGVRRN